MKRQLSILVLMILWAGCADGPRDLEDYGDLRSRPNGVTLMEADHKGGWGRSQCGFCHNIALNIHRGPNSMIDADALAAAYQERGDTYCMTCHGKNGTE